MNKSKGLDKAIDWQPSDVQVGQEDCMELLRKARMLRERGQKEESEQLYALLVQVLRPDHAQAELQI
jgi:hypothetical protein